jgi:uridine kinase
MFGIKPKLIGICGGSSSGKTKISKLLVKHFTDVTQMSMDNYFIVKTDYGGKTRQEYLMTHNFDSPDSFNVELFVKHLRLLCAGKMIEMPIYDFENSIYIGTKTIYPREYILVDGILLNAIPAVREQLYVSIFVNCHNEIRKSRRLKRDVNERGADFETVRHQYEMFVEPMYDIYIEPARIYSDIEFDNSESCNERYLIYKIGELHIKIKRKVNERNLLSGEVDMC